MSRDRCLRVSFFNLDRWRLRAVDRAAARRSVAPAVVRLAGDQIRLRQSKTGTRGWEDARVLRHELGHCSGWPGYQQLLIP